MSRRRVIGVAAAGLLVAFCLLLAFFVGLPTMKAWGVRWQLAAALRDADAVRLEEFMDHISLTTVELPRAEWPRVLDAVPIALDAGRPGLVRMCFFPHHRVVIVDRHGGQLKFEVCFGCEQASTGRSGIFATPYFWRGSLRRLFRSYQILLRSDREYADILEEHIVEHFPPSP